MSAKTEDSPAVPVSAEAPAPRRRRVARSLAIVVLALWVLVIGLAYATLALSGRLLPVPVWAVAEVESRLNAWLGPALGGAAVSLDGIDIAIDRAWVPSLHVSDLRVMPPGGGTLLVLPSATATIDPSALLHGSLRLRRLTVSGAQVQVTRFADGRFNFSFGTGAAVPPITSLEQLFAAVDRAFALPALSRVERVEATALALSLDDMRSGLRWQIGDGRFVLDNRPQELGAELSFSLIQPGAAPARATLSTTMTKGADTARLRATVENVAARDLAAQTSPLAWAAALDAPISGQVSATLDAQGLTAFEGQLEIGQGALRPTDATTPVRFDRADLRLTYDAASGRIRLSDLAVQSDSLRAEASGQAFLLDAEGRRITGPLTGAPPAAFLGQIEVGRVMVDPAGLFEAPVTFSAGAMDLRLALDPFRLDVGQLSLIEGDETISARGHLQATPEGWRLALDTGINRIGIDRLLALWPVHLVPLTRQWLADNVAVGELFDLRAAVRTAPNTTPVVSLDYEFRDTAVRFIKTLPPITGAWGRAGIKDRTYTMVVNQGMVTPPEGGPIRVKSGTFTIGTITDRPARAHIVMQTESTITAALSVLDEPPFRFLTKAGKPVDMAEAGQAVVTTTMDLPLKKGLKPEEVDFRVDGQLLAVTSSKVIPGKTATAEVMTIAADPHGLRLAGAGKLGQVPFDIAYTQGFGPPGIAARPHVEGTALLSQAAVEEFRLGIPDGTVSGGAEGQISVDFPLGAPAVVTLGSDLAGLGLTVPAIGWKKPAAEAGRLDASIELAKPPRVTSLALSGGGLVAEGGSVTTKPDGGIDRAHFDRVTLNRWIDAPVTLVGQGVGQPPAVEIDGGSITLAAMSGAGLGGGGGAGGANVPVTLRLDRLQVSKGLAVTDLRGSFATKGGFNGDFTGLMNGKARLRGSVAPSKHGPAVRVQSDDAGAVLQAAGIFDSARGGKLDLVLTPQEAAGSYDGKATLTDFRVVNDNILAELLNAVSVVGLLEQLDGGGFVFSHAEADLRISPEKVTIRDGAATGASLGVTMSGSYLLKDSRIDLQGVISPIYIVNGIGQFLTRRGEGVLGLNYSVTGTSSSPKVAVNPLSILTPGAFRDLFRMITDGSKPNP